MTRAVVVGNFRVHEYAHHWQGLRLGFEQLPGVEFRAVDPRHDGPAAVPQAIESVRPAAVVFCTVDGMTDEALAAAKAAGAYTALWYCDLRDPEPRDLSGRLDLLLLTAGGQVRSYLQAWKVQEGLWMPQACLPLAVRPEASPGYAADLVHVGTWSHPQYHGGRRKAFTALLKRFPATHPCVEDVAGKGRFVLWNPATEAAKAWVTGQLAEIYASAKVAVGISDHDVYGYHSNRLFLATGHGACYLCNDFPGLDQLYDVGCAGRDDPDPGAEVLAFDVTEDDVAAVAEEWTSDARALDRARIREAGFRRAQSQHTYPKRIAEIWRAIERRR